MRVVKLVCICVAALAFVTQAKDTYSVFSLGLSSPMGSSAVVHQGTSAPDTLISEKSLRMGWDLGWTFFKLPFAESGGPLSGLALGGKISYSRWQRDSTLNEIYFLGTQGILRYYTPFKIIGFEPFIQAGLGLFFGEHGFGDADTLSRGVYPMKTLVTKGTYSGISFAIGMDWDVIEISPGLTMVLTPDKSSAWLSLSAAMKF
jgi:hypothetical protein